MQTAEIKQITLDRLMPNPHRNIKEYPIKESKVDALVRSIQNGDIGLWPSIVARQVRGGYEMAFGHHRYEAAKKAGLRTIPLIVMDLDDQKMLQYMGRENGEDFGTDFMTLLNTWEAGVRFLSARKESDEPVDIARLLGWVTVRGNGDEVMTVPAQACNAAFKLILGGHMERKEFEGMSVATAREIAQRAISLMATVDKDAAKKKTPTSHTAWQKKQIGKAAKSTAKAVRSGNVKPKKVRAEMDSRAFSGVNKKPELMTKPLFDRFAYALCTNIDAMVSHDQPSEKLAEIEKALKHVRLDVDRAALNAVRGSLSSLGYRANNWHGRLANKEQPGVTPLLAKREG